MSASPAPSPAPKRIPQTVWALGVVSLFTDIGGEMVFPLLAPLLKSLPGAGAAAVGMVEGIADGVSHLVKPLVGGRSDRLGRRKPFVLTGYALSGMMRPLLALAQTVLAVTSVRVIDRIGKGIRTAPRDALIAGSVPREQQARAFSLHRAMDHAGAVIGPSIAFVLLAAGLEVRTVILMAAIPGMLAFLTVIFFVHEQQIATSPLAAAPLDHAIPLSGRLKSYLLILFVFSLGASTDALLLVHAGTFLGPKWTTALWIVLHVVKVSTSVPGGMLADRLGPVRVIVAGWMLYGAVYAGFALSTGATAMWLLFGVYGFYYGLTEGAEKAIVSRLAPEGGRGRAFGAMAASMGLGTLIASLGAGWLYKNHGATWAFGIGAVAATISSLLLAGWAAREKPGATSRGSS